MKNEYDALNQLTKVTYPDGTEYSYAYDAGGNLTQWNKNGTTQHIAHYATTGWKDQFVYLDGTGIQYDEIGNPLTWRLGVNLTWEAGRRLSTLQKGETSVSYTYNAEGTRIGKTVNGRSMSQGSVCLELISLKRRLSGFYLRNQAERTKSRRDVNRDIP